MYLDPGLGGMLIQFVVGLLAVGGVFLVSIRRKIVNFFRKSGSSEEGTDEAGEVVTDDGFMDIEDDAAVDADVDAETSDE